MILDIMLDDENYFDVAFYFSIDDELLTGGVLSMTIYKKEKRATAKLTLNDEIETGMVEVEPFDVPLKWAVRIAKEAYRQRKAGRGTPKLTLIFKDSEYPNIKLATHAKVVRGGGLEFSAVDVFKLVPHENFFMEGI